MPPSQPLFLLEYRDFRGLFPQQGHPFAIGGGDENRPFRGRWRRRQTIEKTIGLLTHGTIALFQDVHREPLPKNALELLCAHPERLFHAEHLRELLQQVGCLSLRKIKASVDGPQLDFLLGALGINVGLKAVLAENGPQRSGYDRCTSLQDRAVLSGDAVAKVAISLAPQEQFDSRLPHVQYPREDPTFNVIEAAPHPLPGRAAGRQALHYLRTGLLGAAVAMEMKATPLQKSAVGLDTVNLGYVLNVIENPEERAATLHQAWALCRQLLVVSGQGR